MRPVMLFIIPALFLATLAGLGFALYHATDSRDANMNAVVGD